MLWSLLHVAHVLEDRLEGALSEVGLSAAKYGVLSELVKAEQPLPLSELAARISCVRSNITQLVDRLEADGLVKRVDDPADRRSVRASLTSQGKERQSAGAERVAVLQKEIADSVPGADRSALQRALSSLG